MAYLVIQGWAILKYYIVKSLGGRKVCGVNFSELSIYTEGNQGNTEKLLDKTLTNQ